MNEYEINELRNIRNAVDRLLANVAGDPNAGHAAAPDAEPDFPPFEPTEADEYARRQKESAAKQFESTPPSAIRDPLAKSLNDLVTPKQLGMIRALAREARVDHDEECRKVFKISTEELSKKAASSLIDHLASLKNQHSRRAS
jgi:hypothetical protein